MLYEMTTGIVPFARDTVPRTLAAIIEGKPSGLDVFEKNVPARLRAIIEKTLAKRREERYPSMLELAKALREKRFRSLVHRLRMQCESLVSESRVKRLSGSYRNLSIHARVLPSLSFRKFKLTARCP